MASLKYKFNIQVSFVGELSIDEVIKMLLEEKKRHPQRSIGKGFPGLDSNRLGMLTGGEDLSYQYGDMSAESVNTDIESLDLQTDDVKYILPRRLWLYLLQKININSEMKWATIDNPTINKVAKEVCSSEFAVEGRGMYRDEFVTAGGIPLKEVIIVKSIEN